MTGRANGRTIAEFLVGSCISRRRSCKQSAQVVRSVAVWFYELWHDQSLEGRISCTTKSMIFGNRSFMTGGTTMND